MESKTIRVLSPPAKRVVRNGWISSILLSAKHNVMKKFETKEFLKELDEMGVVYTIDSNPSPERTEKIRKMMEKRDERLKQMVEDYRSGKLKI
jgi:CO dehydrogenase/acetyl-CoA synthase beta subunit